MAASEAATMAVYTSAGRKQILVGDLSGLITTCPPGWKLWENFHPREAPDSVTFGSGFRGQSEDFPHEQVEVVCIATNDSNDKLCIVRRDREGYAGLAPSGFINQQGVLAWSYPLAPPSPTLQRVHLVDLLNFLTPFPPGKLKQLRTRLRKEEGVSRPAGTSRRSAYRHAQEGNAGGARNEPVCVAELCLDQDHETDAPVVWPVSAGGGVTPPH